LGGIFICACSDYFINRIFLKKNIFPNSAVISGFIVSGILDYRQPWLILAIFSLLPAVSKHAIRVNKRHIFNPANFALFIAMFFKLPLTWKIESNIFLIIAFGAYLAYSYKKIPHVVSFLVLFIGLFAFFKMNAFGLISWFFVFIMLPEPKTSGYGAARGFVFGGIAGLAAFLIFRFMPQCDPFISCLFIANLSRAISEKIEISK
jgi:hypothetical protein